MRNIYIYLLPLILAPILVACSAAPQPTTTPTESPGEMPSDTPTLMATTAGNSASITVTVFQDLNQNSQLDPNEPGVVDPIGLAPDTDCTIGDPAVIIDAMTDPSSGEFTYSDLTPGLYCVLYRGAQPLTTEPAYTLTLARGERSEIAFGLAPP